MSTDITISLEAVQREVARFDEIEAGFAELEKAHPRDVVCDVATTAGMEAAIVSRRAWREPRIAVEKARKAAKAPVLALGRNIDSFAAGLEERLRLGENHYDEQIQAEEGRKAAERQRKLQIEAERIAAIRRRIVEVFSVPPSAPGVRISAAMLREIRGHLENEPVDDSFGDLKIEAQETKCAMLEMLGTKIAEQQSFEAEQAALAEARARFAEEQRAETARRVAEREAEDSRRKAEAAALEAQRAENARQQAQIDAQRAELDRREAEAREAERARQEAEQRELCARIDAENRERARQRMAEDAALARLHAAAEPMRQLLDDWRAWELTVVFRGDEKFERLRERRDRILSDLRVADAQEAA